MGVVTPGASTPDELWELLSGEGNVFGESRLYDAGSFYSADPAAEDRSYTRSSGSIGDFTPHPALRKEMTDGTVPSREPTALWLRHCLYHALDGVARTADDRHFAAFGYTADGSQHLEHSLVRSGYERLLRETGAELIAAGTAGGTVSGTRSIAAQLAARYPDPDGNAAEYLPHRVGRNAIGGLLPGQTEVVMVDTACSSALYGLDLARKALCEGSCDVAVSGGAFAFSARTLVLFAKLTGLSRSGLVRCFDRHADGVVFSDGAAVLVLKLLGRARADGDRVLGVIDRVGLSCDGRGKAIYAPNPAGQELALRRAHPDGTESVGWVIAHATGTQAGDSSELASLQAVAGDGPPALLSSNKAIVGHTGWAAGSVSLVQALVGLDRGEAPPQRYLREPVAALAGSRFQPPPGPAKLPTGPAWQVGVSAFGFGGTNAHVVLSPPDLPVNGARPARPETDIALVGWAVDLPGDPGIGQLVNWLRGQGPAPERSFGDGFPLPDITKVRLPPTSMRSMDRTQLMVLRAAGRLSASVRRACEEHRDAVGVIAAHMGPTRLAVQYALRCYLGDLRQAVGPTAVTDVVAARVRALVPPSSEDSFPGTMPNIISARLAAAGNYRGLNLTVDTGPDAALDAVRTAERYLRHGDLDIALIACVNGNSTPELAEILGCLPTGLAEGGFIFALARKPTAVAWKLPVLGLARTSLGPVTPSTRPRMLKPLAGAGRTYLGADGAVALLAGLLARSPVRIGSTLNWGVRLDVGPEPIARGHIGDTGPPLSGP
jgi:3-oxoacyl-(acyl-carrier-protein) synthase